MIVKPVQGSGINSGWDASTNSITISNEGNSPFLYVRVNNKIPFNGVVITNPGSGYEEIPDVAISGGGGTGATARATISNGSISSIVIVENGSGYNDQATVTIDAPTGAGGVQAEAYAILNNQLGYNLFYDFYEVIWDGVDFVQDLGGLKADFATRTTCPKMYSMPYDIDEPTNVGNFAGNVGVSGQGLVYMARLRGVDSTDGRDVYEFWRSLDPSSKCFVTIEDTGIINGYYPASGYDTLSRSSANMGAFWAKDINGGELISGRNYVGYYVGTSYDPYPGNPVDSDPRPRVTVLNSLVAGPSGIPVITGTTCVNGVLSNTFSTFYPSETAQIAEDSRKSFITLEDTPASYTGVANYFVAVNSNATGLTFTIANPAGAFIPSMSFINLNDCPKTYSGTAGRVVTSTGGGLTFTAVTFTTPTDSSVIPKQSTLGTAMQFKLVNDALTPGANKYYGTNADGLKGWYDLPGA
jgi:hypothetical protein